jgi:TRAP-type C4-dicarboxylate transport system permease small subunit
MPTIIDRLSAAYGRLLDGLMLLVCLLLLGMTVLIGLDVLFRNAGLGGVTWSNEVSEDILYLVTLFSAPWLLREGRHIRVDILLRALPARTGWLLEWIGDLLGLACSLFFVWYGLRVTADSLAAGALSIKTLITPEWWLLSAMPVAFALVAVEFLFRMRRLARGERAPRADAVSAS